MSERPITVAGGHTVPEGELEWRFDTSGGPGGQHANRSSTRVELSFDLAASPAVPEELKAQIFERVGPRARNGVIRVSVDETRSQWRNRNIARRRMQELLDDATRARRHRRRTGLPKGAKRRRRNAKRRRSETKRLRQRPSRDD